MVSKSTIVLVSCSVLIIGVLVPIGSLPAQTSPDAKKKESPAATVQITPQLFSYWDAAKKKRYLGYTDEIAALGVLYGKLGPEKESVSFRSCENETLTVPRGEVKPYPGKCGKVEPTWGTNAGIAIEGRFVGKIGETSTFAVKGKDGMEVIFSYPSYGMEGFEPAKDTKVLFSKDPQKWNESFAAGLKEMSTQKTVDIIRDQGFSVFVAKK